MSDAMNDEFLDDMQQELVALLKSDAVLGVLPILDERKGDIIKEVAENQGVLNKVGGKIGACVVLLAAMADDEAVAVAGGMLNTMWTFRVLENPLLNDGPNGFQIRALKICRRIVRVVKLYAAQGLCTALIPDKKTIVPVQDELAPIAYEVRFHCAEQAQGKNLKVAQPAIAPAAGAAPQAVTITCGTAGAAIYYTLDGSHPHAGNALAVLYAGPVNVVAAGTLRARAFKDGYVGSNASAADFT
jgi:hypothetical protein